MTAWIVVTDVSKSATSALTETFIADWSSTMTNWAMAKATSGNQFVFGAGLVDVTECFLPAKRVAAQVPRELGDLRLEGVMPLLVHPLRVRSPPRPPVN